MFVRNFNSIKRDTISVNEKQKKYLMDNGFSPISKNESGWVYLANKNIMSLIKDYENKGGEILFE